MGLLYGRAGRLTAENGDFWRGQVGKCRRLERGLGGVGIETVNMVRKTSHACAGMYVWANGVMTYCEAKREIEMAEKEDSTRSGGNSFDSFKPKSVAEWRAAAADEAKQGYKQQTPEAAAAGIKEMARQERLAKVAAEQRAEKASRDLAEQYRDFSQIQRRRRWKTASSVQRYAKTHAFMESVLRIPQAVKSKGDDILAGRPPRSVEAAE